MKNEIMTTCRALFGAQQVTELRILEIPGRQGFKYNGAGWFNDWDALAETVVKYHARAPSGIYVTINPLHPATLARTNNTLIERLRDTSSDRDVIRRAWLPIDLDPVRPSGVSASLEELQKAKAFGNRVVAFLEGELKFPPGLKAHSGNGVHLLYRIDVANDDNGKQLVKQCLEALATKFDDAGVHVDRSLHNASRILKLWGTATRKGQHLDQRPHRKSRLWTPRLFADIAIVSEPQLQQLAALAPVAATRVKSPVRGKPATAKVAHGGNGHEFHFDLDAFIDRHHIDVARQEVFDGTGTRYILAHCLFDTSHTRTSAILGRAPSGAIFYKCQHESCADKDWKAVKALLGDARPAADETVGETDEESPWSLASTFLEEEYTADDLGRITLRRHREQFYAYQPKDHVYRPISFDKVQSQVTRWLGENGIKNTKKMVADVLNSVGSHVTTPEELEVPFRTFIDPETKCACADPQKHNWITLRNGVLDLDAILAGEKMSDCLKNHTAEWLSTTILPFNFPTTEAEALADRWLRFLDEILEGDGERIRTIQEMFGYCFWRSTELETFFILQGRGNNGKSTILDVLSMLLGQENITNLSLDQLADPILRFELYQKVANICSDLPELDRVEEGILKRIASGEPIVCNRKYKDAMRFAPKCKLIFSTNPLPRFTDPSLGTWRRMKLIPFEYVVPPEKVDIHLKDSFNAELPGILLWSLEGAARLAYERKFSTSSACDRVLRDYRMSCFPVLTFLEECTRPEGNVTTKLLWQTYKQWCHEFGLSKVKPLHTFVRDAVNFRPHVQYPRVPSGLASEITLEGLSLVPDLVFGMDARTTSTDRPGGYWT